MLDFVEQHQGVLSLAVATVAFVLLSVCEIFIPRRRPATSMGWRWLNNISLFVITSVVLRQVQIILPISAAMWASSTQFGLLKIWQPGWLLVLAITFLVMDFSTYVYHRFLHSVPLLWRLHVVHHSDTEFDLTTTYRNHPFVAIFLQIVRVPVILLLGPPIYAIVIYEMTNIALDFFSHSNVRIPQRIENWLRHAIVTPDFHRTHHSSARRFTNSNFSGMFPVFDYLFGTASYKPYSEHEKLEVGLEYLRSPRNTRIDQLLIMPFKKLG